MGCLKKSYYLLVLVLDVDTKVGSYLQRALMAGRRSHVLLLLFLLLPYNSQAMDGCQGENGWQSWSCGDVCTHHNSQCYCVNDILNINEDTENILATTQGHAITTQTDRNTEIKKTSLIGVESPDG